MIGIVEDKRAEVAVLCEKYGVKRFDLFGSAAGGQAGAGGQMIGVGTGSGVRAASVLEAWSHAASASSRARGRTRLRRMTDSGGMGFMYL